MTAFEVVYDWPTSKGGSTISVEDCDFLRSLCLQYNPTKILEVGTGSGRSTWAMALSSDCDIHTIDKEDWYSNQLTNDKIKRYITYSTQWLNDYDIEGFDFIFFDAFIPYSNFAKILSKVKDNCSIVLHDYYHTDIDKMYPDKGYRNFKSLMQYLFSGDSICNYGYTLTVGGACCAHIRLERETNDTV